MSTRANVVASPLVAKAYKLNKFIFRRMYSYPLDILFENGQISIKVHPVLQPKYFPFLISLFVFTFLIGFSSCTFLPFLKLFRPNTNVSVVQVIFSILFAFYSFLEWGIYAVYSRSTEFVKVLNEVLAIERTYYKVNTQKSTDWVGILLIALHFGVIILCPLIPLGACIGQVDPLYSIFEMVLPSHQRSIFTFALIPCLRLFFAALCALEFFRFGTIFMFLCIIGAYTMITCLHQLDEKSSDLEQSTINLYIQLRVVVKLGDYFVRNVMFIILLCSQMIYAGLWWIAIRCWNVLPEFLCASICLTAILATAMCALLLPRGVEISDFSEKFVERKKDLYHTFNRFSKNRYLFLQWKAQRMLPIRFGIQFTLNKDTPINYINLLMTNLTNAVLLINP